MGAFYFAKVIARDSARLGECGSQSWESVGRLVAGEASRETELPGCRARLVSATWRSNSFSSLALRCCGFTFSELSSRAIKTAPQTEQRPEISRSLLGPIWRTSTSRGVRSTVILPYLTVALTGLASSISITQKVVRRNTVFAVCRRTNRRVLSKARGCAGAETSGIAGLMFFVSSARALPTENRRQPWCK